MTTLGPTHACDSCTMVLVMNLLNDCADFKVPYNTSSIYTTNCFIQTKNNSNIFPAVRDESEYLNMKSRQHSDDFEEKSRNCKRFYLVSK